MYLDILFIISVLVHYFLLLLTARLFHRQASAGRLLAGAALGAPAVLLLPFSLSTITVAAVLLGAPLLMILVAFWPLRWAEVLFSCGAFFLFAFMLAGALSALLNFDGARRFFATPGGVLLLLGSCAALYLLFALLRPFSAEKKWQKCWRVELEVAWRGKEKIVPAFLDTGNRLRDPFSSLPVIVVDYRSLEGLLPPPLYRILADETMEPWSALEKLPDPVMARHFTLIPCRGVGPGKEILLGLKPDRVILHEGGRSRSLGSAVFLGLSRRGFGPAADYRALLPPELLHAG